MKNCRKFEERLVRDDSGHVTSMELSTEETRLFDSLCKAIIHAEKDNLIKIPRKHLSDYVIGVMKQLFLYHGI